MRQIIGPDRSEPWPLAVTVALYWLMDDAGISGRVVAGALVVAVVAVVAVVGVPCDSVVDGLLVQAAARPAAVPARATGSRAR